MKPLKLFLGMMMMWLPAVPCSAQRMFSEVGSMQGVTSVFVGRMMLRLTARTMDFDAGRTAIDISRLLNDLESIEVVGCDDRRVAADLTKTCGQILAKYPFEVITDVTGDGQHTTISGVFGEDGKFLTMLLISTTGNDGPTYILLKGKIDVETLRNDAFLVEFK